MSQCKIKGDRVIITNSTWYEINETIRATGMARRAAGLLTFYLRSYAERESPHALVDKLKNLYVALVLEHSHADVPYTNKLPTRTPGGRKIKPWKGPLSLIFRTSYFSRHHFDLMLGLLKITGLIIAPDATFEDYKALGSRLSELKDEYEVRVMSNDLTDEMVDKKELDNLSVIHHYYPNWITGMKAPYPVHKKTLIGNKMMPKSGLIRSDYVSSCFDFPSLVYNHYNYVQSFFGRGYFPDRSAFKPRKGSKDYAGMVSILNKDRGLKLRPIANCSVVLQGLIYPIHYYLKTGLKDIPECHCFDQERGVQWAKEEFNKGYIITSLDLSSASDYIPLSSQLAFLADMLRVGLEEEPEGISIPELLLVYQRINRMYWKTPKVGGSQEIRWKRGTALGAYASYYLFTSWIINRFYRLGMKGCFAIVGDDIMYHSKYDNKVLQMFEDEGIVISLTKSFIHNPTYAEFCGRLIDKEGAFKFTKANPISIQKDVYGKIRQYGLRAINTFRSYRQLRKNDQRQLRKFHQNEVNDVNYYNNKFRVEVPVVNIGGATIDQLYKRGQFCFAIYNLLKELSEFYSHLSADECTPYKFFTFIEGTCRVTVRNRIPNPNRKGRYCEFISTIDIPRNCLYQIPLIRKQAELYKKNLNKKKKLSSIKQDRATMFQLLMTAHSTAGPLSSDFGLSPLKYLLGYYALPSDIDGFTYSMNTANASIASVKLEKVLTKFETVSETLSPLQSHTLAVLKALPQTYSPTDLDNEDFDTLSMSNIRQINKKSEGLIRVISKSMLHISMGLLAVLSGPIWLLPASIVWVLGLNYNFETGQFKDRFSDPELIKRFENLIKRDS